MFRIELAGAWEGDALPGGRFCAAYPDGRIVTHAGTWQAPDWLRYPRLNPLADQVVGTRQVEPCGVVLISALGWEDFAPQSCGLSAVIYDSTGYVHVNRDCAAPYYSLGFRYIDRNGQVVSGSDTYADPARQIYEWTELDGITIGQGPVDGVHILLAGRRYLLEPGPARVVRFNKTGEACAVGLFRQDLGFVACSFMVDEIVTLPDITDDEPPPPPEDDVKPPVVTVQNWTLDELKDGREFVFSDSANPQLGYKVRVHVRDGSMYAELENTAGYATTGQKRPVKPCEDSGGGGGNGGHEPPPPQHSPIATDHGTFWQVGRDGVLSHGEREDPFEIGLAENGRYTFKAPNGLYVCAEDGGADNKLIANRESAGGWEQFTRGSSGSGDKPRGFTLQADNGRYIAAELDGRLTCDRTSGGGWETFEAPAIVGTTPRLVIRDRIYFGQEDGTRWHAIECSDFSLYKKFLDSEDIGPVLAQRAQVGFNMLRVWLLNTSVIPGGLEPGSYLNFYQHLPEFLRLCASYGLYVELTAFTQTQTLMPDDSDQIAHWTDVADAIRDSPNVLLELVNEADQHDNATSATFAKPSGVLSSSGSNGSDQWPPEPDWDYLLYHTNDAPEFQRKVGHNAWEISEHRGDRPCISNENTRFDDKDADLDHAYDAAAGAALLCAGACFHSVRGKISELWGGHELKCAEAWVAGAKSVPLEYQPGSYSRHDELNGPDCIRAYSRTLPDGRSWLVKIRP